MFERFRRTNDPARETDGGAVAVDERDEPATSVAAPADDPAARERRLEELHDYSGRGRRYARARPRATWSRLTATVSRARSAPPDDRSRPRRRRRRRTAHDAGRRRRGHHGGHARPPARSLRRHPLGQRLLRPAERHRPRRDPAGHRRRGGRDPRSIRDQRRPHRQRRHHRPGRRDRRARERSRSRGTAAAMSPGVWRASTVLVRASAYGCGRSSSAPRWPSPP